MKLTEKDLQTLSDNFAQAFNGLAMAFSGAAVAMTKVISDPKFVALVEALELESPPVKKDMSKERLEIIRKACGYVGNGTSQSIHIFQDDATGTWIMCAGAYPNPRRLEAYSERGFGEAIDAFGEKYKDVLE